MNAHFFGAKRAFYATLRVARPALAELGLTPARFDLMYALLPAADQTFFRLRQSELRDVLGVSGATVCRMLRSLETLGFIKRRREESEKRQRIVELTKEGVARVRAVCDDLIDSDSVALALDSALGGERWLDRGYCFLEKDTADSVFRRIRHGFGDKATLTYRWHYDD